MFLVVRQCRVRDLGTRHTWVKFKHPCLLVSFIDRKSPTGQDFVENVKHKVWLKVGLDDIEIVKSKSILGVLLIKQYLCSVTGLMKKCRWPDEEIGYQISILWTVAFVLPRVFFFAFKLSSWIVLSLMATHTMPSDWRLAGGKCYYVLSTLQTFSLTLWPLMTCVPKAHLGSVWSVHKHFDLLLFRPALSQEELNPRYLHHVSAAFRQIYH